MFIIVSLWMCCVLYKDNELIKQMLLEIAKKFCLFGVQLNKIFFFLQNQIITKTNTV